MINNLESYNKAQLIELVKAQIEEYQKLDKERDELNEKFEEYFDAFMNCKCIPRNMEAHNLEQQANGIARFTELHLSGHSLFKSLSANYCSVLLIQAKQLREGVK